MRPSVRLVHVVRSGGRKRPTLQQEDRRLRVRRKMVRILAAPCRAAEGVGPYDETPPAS